MLSWQCKICSRPFKLDVYRINDRSPSLTPHLGFSKDIFRFEKLKNIFNLLIKQAIFFPIRYLHVPFLFIVLLCLTAGGCPA